MNEEDEMNSIYKCAYCSYQSLNIDEVHEHVEQEHDGSKKGHSAIEWGDAETKFMLSKYEEYLTLVDPMKKFKRKKDLWEFISSEINSQFNIIVTSVQCENRYKTVLKRKKKAIENNGKSGSSRVKVPYEDELSAISAIDDSIEPEVRLDSTCCVTTNKPSSGGNKRKKQKCENNVPESLLGHLEKKEEAREKRHQEKLTLMAKLIENIERANNNNV